MKSVKRVGLVLLAFCLGLAGFYMVQQASSKGSGPIQSTMERIEKNFIRVPQPKDSVVKNLDSNVLKRREPLNLSLKDLRNPKKILIGYAGSSKGGTAASALEMDQKLGVRMDLIQIYTAWGSKASQQFPAKKVREILALGSIPIITWEPWLSDFSNDIPNQAAADQREVNPLKAIYNGVYDKYILDWAKQAAAMNAPIYLRFAHEMNDPYRYPWGPHNNAEGDFVKAWIHVHDIFKKAKAHKVIWMWSIHSAYDDYDSFYPGDEYVDLISTGILNFGTSVYWSKWWSFDELLANHYPSLSKYRKPIVIVEFGSLKVGGSRKKWYTDALTHIPKSYKNIKGIVFFNIPSDKTLTDKSVTWELMEGKEETKAIKDLLLQYKKSAIIHP
jgi:hypothetical protein